MVRDLLEAETTINYVVVLLDDIFSLCSLLCGYKLHARLYHHHHHHHTIWSSFVAATLPLITIRRSHSHLLCSTKTDWTLDCVKKHCHQNKTQSNSACKHHKLSSKQEIWTRAPFTTEQTCWQVFTTEENYQTLLRAPEKRLSAALR